MTIENPIIKKLLKEYRELSMLSRVSALLSWDLNVNLPPQAAMDRAEQLAYFAKKITQKWQSPGFRGLLDKANEMSDLSLEEQAIVRNLNRGAKYYYSVPKAVIIKKERITAEAFPVWSQARAENDFKKFLPYLKKIIDLDQQIAGFLGFSDNPYDALLDMYEPELSVKECERLFSGMKKELVPLIRAITSNKSYSPNSFLSETSNFPQIHQETLLHSVIKAMGFDETRGRVDVSPHPFTIGLSQHDVRLTTHYSKTDFRDSFTSATHEAGHGLYEQGVNPEFADTPLGGGVSLGIHEALSRFWENMVGKNPLFLKTYVPEFRKSFSEQLNNVSDEAIIRSFNMVKPSLIRIHADEVTYSLHIILRFEMENELISGKIAVADAAEAWREKSKTLLGIVPEKDSEGVLQDVHWTYGSFGYFPSYALGNLYGAQFLDTMDIEVNFEQCLQNGNLLAIKDWLDRNIHRYGSLYLPKELVKRVTGKPLDHTHFLRYLRNKYSVLYDLE